MHFDDTYVSIGRQFDCLVTQTTARTESCVAKKQLRQSHRLTL